MRLAEEGFPDAGPSPLSRGIRGAVAPGPVGLRIIPALAGNTVFPVSCRFARWDHPRSRGEYYLGPQEDNQHLGSSPLSRGIPPAPTDSFVIAGIIPALAGNTLLSPTRSGLRPDHPRSRGEYTGPGGVVSDKKGSSPLSRGILLLAGGLLHPGRIIPALAGNTPSRCRSSTRHPDHPRSRGEYHSAGIPSRSGSGSSPLSRGIRVQQPGKRPARRIIPALAGNTAA